ncbi:hypothetical protein [Actinomycetospora termitidis]|uniref:Uncharacterized protein n=1 Tax=Actinomycetospora termitidis TaxID=3053470 RepID=A0ABT7MFG4_9PSEU|nr:hypothetical protein [Actinomycetospora sp. Odt1-22]MDL5159395.1 hypothetical protein [Actinomycetospora sp. Odt1-22]
MTAPTAPEGQRVAMEDVQDVYGAQLAALHHQVAGLTLENRALHAELETLRQQQPGPLRGGDPGTFAPPVDREPAV